MHLSSALHLPTLRPYRRAAQPERPVHTISPAAARERRSAVPCDRALYRCGCGYAFTAEVTTSVPCPHCGTHQAW